MVVHGPPSKSYLAHLNATAGNGFIHGPNKLVTGPEQATAEEGRISERERETERERERVERERDERSASAPNPSRSP